MKIIVRRFLRERNVEQVLVTHHHEDHSGNGARLQRELEATVFFLPSGVTLARDGFPLRAYQRVIWGTPKRFVPRAMPDEMSVGRGFRLRAVHAPGHSPDMTCYLEAERGWLHPRPRDPRPKALASSAAEGSASQSF